jgi:hypothetical protein
MRSDEGTSQQESIYTYMGPATSDNFNPQAFSHESCIGGKTVEQVYAEDTKELGEENWDVGVQTLKDLVVEVLQANNERLKNGNFVQDTRDNAQPVANFEGVRAYLNFARMTGLSRYQLFPKEQVSAGELSNEDGIIEQKDILAHDIHILVEGDSPDESFSTTINPDIIYMAARHRVLQKGEENPYALTGSQLRSLIQKHGYKLGDPTTNVNETNEKPSTEHYTINIGGVIYDEKGKIVSSSKVDPTNGLAK